MRNILFVVFVTALLTSCGTSSTSIDTSGSLNSGTTVEVSTGVTEETATTDTSTGESLYATPFTLEEIARHIVEEDCYTVIDGKVYNISAFFGKHPGGDQNLLKVCGIDATSIFEQQHGNNREAQEALAEFQIGVL